MNLNLIYSENLTEQRLKLAFHRDTNDISISVCLRKKPGRGNRDFLIAKNTVELLKGPEAHTHRS